MSDLAAFIFNYLQLIYFYLCWLNFWILAFSFITLSCKNILIFEVNFIRLGCLKNILKYLHLTSVRLTWSNFRIFNLIRLDWLNIPFILNILSNVVALLISNYLIYFHQTWLLEYSDFISSDLTVPNISNWISTDYVASSNIQILY